MSTPPAPLPAMFFSTFAYAACKSVGADLWPSTLKGILEAPDTGPSVLGVAGFAFLTLSEARHVAPCVVHVAANSYIARARCVAAAYFLRGPGQTCDVWLSCDDDTFADEATLRRLVTACRATRGLVALPTGSRDGRCMNYRRVFGPTEWWELRPDETSMVTESEREGALPLRRVDRVGQGLVAMHRAFIETLDRGCPSELRFRDRIAPDAHDCPGLFLSGPQGGDWVGEDYWLCALGERAGLPTHVLLEATVQHEAIVTKLDLDGIPYIYGADRADAMARSIEDMNEQARLAGFDPQKET